MTPRLFSSANMMTPAFGGPDQRQGRMGSRYAIDVEMPPLSYEAAQDWADIDDEEATVVMEIDQPDLDVGEPGAPVVDGSGQLGRVLKLRGFTPGYGFRKNQWLSILIGQQRFAYRARAVATADDQGRMTLPLRTLLRLPAGDNATVEVKTPKIEGYPTPTEDCWSVDAEDRQVNLAFTIKERE